METTKPFLCDNGSHRGYIKLAQDDKPLQDDREVEKNLNNFLKEALWTLDINKDSYIINPDPVNISDPNEKTISKFKFHCSILLMNDKILNPGKFSFKPN